MRVKDLINENLLDIIRMNLTDHSGGMNPSGFTRIEVSGEGVFDVGNDYIRSGNVYSVYSADRANEVATREGFIIPSPGLLRAIYNRARIIPMPTQPQWDPNSRFYPRGDPEYHTQQILELTGGSFPSGLVAGHKKEWQRLPDGSVGMIGGAKPGGGFWQEFGERGQAHLQRNGTNGHSDYSQGFRIIRQVE